MYGYKGGKTYIILGILIVFLAVSIITVISIGSARISIGTVYKILADKILYGGRGLAGGIYKNSDYQIVWNIRLPRVIMGMAAGSGLAICGAAMQSLLLNPIADPYILGVSSGASAGASLALLFPMGLFIGGYQVTIFAMFGALGASFLVYTMALAGSGKKIQSITLLLSGMAVNAMMTAITSLLIFLAKSNEGIAAVYNWQMGSIASAQWKTLAVSILTVMTAAVFFILKYRDFNLIMMGEEEAIALGLKVTRFRLVTALFITLVIASLVSVSGIIGFVGLIVPHMARFLCRTSNNKVIFSFSLVLGAIFLIWADTLSRSGFGSAELPIGIVTAFVGGPFFLYLMIKKNYSKGKV
ncbi:MAG: iron ABC transporter permease [Spirochaetaceae bacterium]|jgi:iron complex transport system permease protein|nr:iron ABC transporter permease [Spirochaetaceae bacterium]